MSEKITEYRVVWADCRNGINDGVNEMIMQGWQPLGSAFERSSGYSQTMVKYGLETSAPTTSERRIELNL